MTVGRAPPILISMEHSRSISEDTLVRDEATAPVRAVDPWVRLSRATGIVGLATLVLIFSPVVAISTLGEPSLTATTEEATPSWSTPV